jgi:hypothetical protein
LQRLAVACPEQNRHGCEFLHIFATACLKSAEELM